MNKFISFLILSLLLTNSVFASIECTGVENAHKSKKKEVLFTYHRNTLYMKDGGTEFFVVPFIKQDQNSNLIYKNQKYLITLNLKINSARIMEFSGSNVISDRSFNKVTCQGNGYE